MIKMPRNKKKPLVRVWSGTPVHASIDTRMHMRLVELLKKDLRDKCDSSWEGDYSIVDVYQKEKKVKRALITHHGRSGYRNPYTPAQTDAEAIIVDMHSGALPQGIKLYVTAHRHSVDGTMEHRGIRVIRSPAFVTFIPYKGALTLMPHIIPDVGAWIIIISKDGRIYLQEWLYPPFLYNYEKNVIYRNDLLKKHMAGKSYVDPEKFTIDEPLPTLLRQASRVILILADTHVGELQAVCPPSFVDANGFIRKIQLTDANKELLKYWEHLAYMSSKFFKPDEIWLIGDAFAGQMPAKFEKFRKITLGNLDDQCYATFELFRRLIDGGSNASKKS